MNQRKRTNGCRSYFMDNFCGRTGARTLQFLFIWIMVLFPSSIELNLKLKDRFQYLSHWESVNVWSIFLSFFRFSSIAIELKEDGNAPTSSLVMRNNHTFHKPRNNTSKYLCKKYLMQNNIEKNACKHIKYRGTSLCKTTLQVRRHLKGNITY